MNITVAEDVFNFSYSAYDGLSKHKHVISYERNLKLLEKKEKKYSKEIHRGIQIVRLRDSEVTYLEIDLENGLPVSVDHVGIFHSNFGHLHFPVKFTESLFRVSE